MALYKSKVTSNSSPTPPEPDVHQLKVVKRLDELLVELKDGGRDLYEGIGEATSSAEGPEEMSSSASFSIFTGFKSM